jgi:hypothetical protein
MVPSRILKWVKIWKGGWNNQLKDLTFCAWTWALKKTRHDLSSSKAAKQIMFTIAQKVTKSFVFRGIEKNETR